MADTKFTVMGLKENQVVEFRVSAVNQGGNGKPSKPTKPHTVKDPICKYEDGLIVNEKKKLNLIQINKKLKNKKILHCQCSSKIQ